MTNNSTATIDQIDIKLRDPSGVFQTFYVGYTYVPAYSIGPVLYSSPAIGVAPILNTWLSSISYTTLKLWADPKNYPVFTTALGPKQSSNIVCGFLGDASNSNFTVPITINPNISPGTYTCYFDLRFTVTSGVFNGPPSLSIPWQVTIV